MDDAANLPFDTESIVESSHEIDEFRSISCIVYAFSTYDVNVLYLISQSFPIDVYHMLNKESRIELKKRIFQRLTEELISNYNEYTISSVK